MSVLVTGGAGYIGSHMALELVDTGENVVVLDDLSTGCRQSLPKTITLIVGDTADRSLIKELIHKYGVDAIMHFAGSIIVPESISDPLGYYYNNTVKSRHLIEAAVNGNVNHFIFSSTAAVYGMPRETPIFEDAPLEPISPYGASKMMTEMMLRDTAHAHDFNFIALRYFNVAGADPSGRSGQSTAQATHLIKVASQAALGRQSCLEVFGTNYPTPDGSCIRDYIHVTDLVRAHMAALTYLRKGGQSQIFNCGYGRGSSVLEVVEVVKKLSGENFEVRIMDRRPGDPSSLIAGVDRIRDVLGWTPEFDDLDTIVAHALAWEERCV